MTVKSSSNVNSVKSGSTSSNHRQHRLLSHRSAGTMTGISSYGLAFFLSKKCLTNILTGLCCFYLGLMIGLSSKHSTTLGATSSSSMRGSAAMDCPKCPDHDHPNAIHPVVDCNELESILARHDGVLNPKQQQSVRQMNIGEAVVAPPQGKNGAAIHTVQSAAAAHVAAQRYRQLHNFEKNASMPTFPSTVNRIVVDYGTVDRDSFMKHIDLGVPPDITQQGLEDVLILYGQEKSLPTKSKIIGKENLLNLSPDQALENCQTLKVILTEPLGPRKSNQCIAIIPQWESYSIYKYMRVNTQLSNKRRKGDYIDTKYPLQFVARTHSDKNTVQQIPDYNKDTIPSYNVLVDYIQSLPNAQQEMENLLSQAGINNDKKQPLIVQVCNKGQSELFMNFICTARARGLDVSRVMLFATDQYTLDLCRNLGLKLCYYNEDIFGSMPEAAAHHYADKVFSKMMMAKVYCVHMTLTLGYSVLFQDVDLIWYKDPLPYFQNNDLQWDILFQDDGARTPRYAPYSPNTGFYFVRHNSKTLFLFNRLLKMGDTVAKYGSHQAALNAALIENVSWIGLRVKVWRWGENNEFIGGIEYHRNKDYMRRFIKNQTKVQPYIFHMSWTTNKANKKLYFEQMGEWRVKEGCPLDSDGIGCCLAQPNIKCHYRDKPSIIPCKDSPPIDKGKPSFW